MIITKSDADNTGPFICSNSVLFIIFFFKILFLTVLDRVHAYGQALTSKEYREFESEILILSI